MARFKTIQTSFVAGEFDPTLFGRADIDDYKNAADKLRNVYVRPQGGAFRREGLEYYAGVNGNNQARVVSFQFNEEQTYVLVFTAGRMDVYKTDSKTLQATVTTSPISGLTYTQISEMTYTQSADTLILFHKDVQPIRITRTSDTAWTAVNESFENIPAFAFSGVTLTNPSWNIQPDVTTGRVIVSGTSTPNFTAGVYEGQFINMPKGGRIYVTQVNSTTEIEGIITVELESTDVISSGDWELESGYEDVMSSSRGWPRCGTFHKSRLMLGGLKSRPQTLLGSRIGDFFNFEVGEGLDDEAIDVTIDDDEVNIIRHLFSGRGLNIFTSGGEFSLRSSIDEALTPSTAATQIQKETRHGCSWTAPVSIDGSVVFIEGEEPTDATKGRIVRQFLYNDAEQSFNANNISILSQHLITNPVQMAIRRSTATHPSNYLYMVNDDGTCAVLNSLREQNLLAITLFETQGDFESVCVSGNKTFFVVKRSIDGSDVRYLEVLNSDNTMDASLVQTSGSETTSWSGLSHLDGEECRVRGDDFILGNETPSSGSITSDESVSELEVGLMFAARVKSVPLDIIIQGQSDLGEFKSCVFANVRCYQSRNFKMTHDGRNFVPNFRQFGDSVLDQPVANFTGWKKLYIGGIRRDVQIEITQDDPLELNILAINFEVRIA